jgi:acyl-coenzyme A synthetase/AMP-(fatty) acid ligase
VGELLVTREDLGVGPVLTGDLGRRDADGVLHLVGRADRMVKVGGVRVEPAALEAALAEVDGVADAAVVAVPDEDVGVRLVAHVYVVARSGADAGRLIANVRALGPPGADGLRVVRRDAPLPLLASGKPDLRHLAAG